MKRKAQGEQTYQNMGSIQAGSFSICFIYDIWTCRAQSVHGAQECRYRHRIDANAPDEPPGSCRMARPSTTTLNANHSACPGAAHCLSALSASGQNEGDILGTGY